MAPRTVIEFRVLIHDSEVEIGIRLFVRRLCAVTLDVGLRNRESQIVAPNPVVECSRFCLLLALGRPKQGKQGIAPHFLEDNYPRTERGDLFDQSTAFLKVARRSRDSIEGAKTLLALHIHRQRGMALRNRIRKRRVIDRQAQLSVGGHVFYPVPTIKDAAAVPQTINILRRRSDGHSKLPRGHLAKNTVGRPISKPIG